jgi:hypothetical protein
MTVVVDQWVNGSNGQVEARLFEFDRPLAETDVSTPFLLSLGLDALAGEEAGELGVSVISPSNALSILFSAASTGGAYTRGRHGAYGRLDSWTSMGALVGASAGDPIENLAKQSKECLWLSVDPTIGWFCQVAWDFGLICVRPDRRSLAALMATDTD